jgi:hypothetical protein
MRGPSRYSFQPHQFRPRLTRSNRLSLAAIESPRTCRTPARRSYFPPSSLLELKSEMGWRRAIVLPEKVPSQDTPLTSPKSLL